MPVVVVAGLDDCEELLIKVDDDEDEGKFRETD